MSLMTCIQSLVVSMHSAQKRLRIALNIMHAAGLLHAQLYASCYSSFMGIGHTMNHIL